VLGRSMSRAVDPPGAVPQTPAVTAVLSHPFRPSADHRLSDILGALVDSRSHPGTVGSDEPRTDPAAARRALGRRS
jgi:hypothetical protein